MIKKNTSKCVVLGNIFGRDKGTSFAGNVWNKNYLAASLTTMQGGYRQPLIIVNKDNIKNEEI